MLYPERSYLDNKNTVKIIVLHGLPGSGKTVLQDESDHNLERGGFNFHAGS
jgi:predicted ATPase